MVLHWYRHSTAYHPVSRNMVETSCCCRKPKRSHPTVNSTVPLLFFLLLPPPAAAASGWGVRAHPDTIASRKFGTLGLSKSTCVATGTSSEPARQTCVSRCAHMMAPAAGQVPLARAVRTCRHRHHLSTALLAGIVTNCAVLLAHLADDTTQHRRHTRARHTKMTVMTDTPRPKHHPQRPAPPTPSAPDTTRLTRSHAESSLAPAAPERAGNASASAPACLGATLDDSPAQTHTPQERPCRVHGVGQGYRHKRHRHAPSCHVQGHKRTTRTLAVNAMHTDTNRPHLLPTALRWLPQPPESRMAKSEPPRSLCVQAPWSCVCFCVCVFVCAKCAEASRHVCVCASHP
jgi:hypothetical protein